MGRCRTARGTHRQASRRHRLWSGGLACAAQLNRAGHWVTVFERADRIGGLLMYGIPNMKLEKTNSRSAASISWPQKAFVRHQHERRRQTIRSIDLLQEFDAIVLCGGATRPRDLNLEGRNSMGIHFAMEFLHAQH